MPLSETFSGSVDGQYRPSHSGVPPPSTVIHTVLGLDIFEQRFAAGAGGRRTQAVLRGATPAHDSRYKLPLPVHFTLSLAGA